MTTRTGSTVTCACCEVMRACLLWRALRALLARALACYAQALGAHAPPFLTPRGERPAHAQALDAGRPSTISHRGRGRCTNQPHRCTGARATGSRHTKRAASKAGIQRNHHATAQRDDRRLVAAHRCKPRGTTAAAAGWPLACSPCRRQQRTRSRSNRRSSSRRPRLCERRESGHSRRCRTKCRRTGV